MLPLKLSSAAVDSATAPDNAAVGPVFIFLSVSDELCADDIVNESELETHSASNLQKMISFLCQNHSNSCLDHHSYYEFNIKQRIFIVKIIFSAADVTYEHDVY